MSARPRIAILTSHGQPSAPPPPEIHLAAVAAAVQDHLPEWDVQSATLSSKGFLEAAMREDGGHLPFYGARLVHRQGAARQALRLALPYGDALDWTLRSLILRWRRSVRNWHTGAGSPRPRDLAGRPWFCARPQSRRGRRGFCRQLALPCPACA